MISAVFKKVFILFMICAICITHIITYGKDVENEKLSLGYMNAYIELDDVEKEKLVNSVNKLYNNYFDYFERQNKIYLRSRKVNDSYYQDGKYVESDYTYNCVNEFTIDKTAILAYVIVYIANNQNESFHYQNPDGIYIFNMKNIINNGDFDYVYIEDMTDILYDEMKYDLIGTDEFSKVKNYALVYNDYADGDEFKRFIEISENRILNQYGCDLNEIWDFAKFLQNEKLFND